MSGKFEKKDGFIIIIHDNDEPIVKTTAECYFDTQVDEDIALIKTNQDTIKFLKRGCLAKLLLFPIEWLLIRIFLGEESAKTVVKMNKAYYSFLRGKSSLEEVRKYI